MAQVFGGLLFTLVGPAGAGKNTVMRQAIEALPGLRQLPTATTRAIRPTEQEGREHFFITVSEFMALRDAGKLLEQQIVHGNWYGIARDPLEAALGADEMMIADIDMFGAQAARTHFPHNTVLVFVAPPSIPILAARMYERGETPSEIARRMLRVQREMAFAPECDYIVVNDTLERATQSLLEIIAWEHSQHAARVAAASKPALQYRVRTLVTYGEFVAVSDSNHLPERIFDSSEVPHMAALDVLQPLGIAPPNTALTTHQEDGVFIPPALIDVEQSAQIDDCIYYYVVRLDDQETLAPGWKWQPMDQAGLREPIMQLVKSLVVA